MQDPIWAASSSNMAMGVPMIPPMPMMVPMTPQMMPNQTPLPRMESVGDGHGSNPRHMPISPVPPNMPRDSIETVQEDHEQKF